MLNILEEIEEKNYSIPILVLLLLKAWVGFESKEGDIDGFDEDYDSVIKLMDDFTKDTGYFESLPAISEALEEQHKTRLTLLSHVKLILSSYSDFSSPDTIFSLAQSVKEDHADLDIEGYWNECGGRMERPDSLTFLRKNKRLIVFEASASLSSSYRPWHRSRALLLIANA